MGDLNDRLNLDNFDENSVAQTRRRKMQEFRKKMDTDSFVPLEDELRTDGYDLSAFDSSFGSDAVVPSNEEITSYSDEGVKERIAKNSKKEQKKQQKQERKQRLQKGKKNRIFFRVTWITAVVIVGLFLGQVFLVGMNDLLAINRKDETAVTVSVPQNVSIGQIADILYDNGLINSKGWFEFYTNSTSAAGLFKQGKFELTRNMDYESIINHLQTKANRTDTVKIMFPEGMSVLEIAASLKENGVIPDTKDFLNLCNSHEFDEDFTFLKELKNNDKRYYLLEGYLYPDTYDFYVNESPEDIIYKFLDNFETKIFYTKMNIGKNLKGKTIAEYAADSDYSLDQIVNLASIIQDEALDTNDMYKISSVLHNRLEYGDNHDIYTLSCDSTSFYPYLSAKNVPKDIASTFKSRYDTYQIQGLPPGAIDSPGLEAIKAALAPTDTDYFYFCHSQGDDPQAYYAVTWGGHQDNLAEAGLLD